MLVGSYIDLPSIPAPYPSSKLHYGDPHCTEVTIRAPAASSIKETLTVLESSSIQPFGFGFVVGVGVGIVVGLCGILL